MTKLFLKHSDNESAKKYGDKVTEDIWGPAEVKSIGSSSYFALFKDVAMRERPTILHEEEIGDTALLQGARGLDEGPMWSRRHEDIWV